MNSRRPLSKPFDSFLAWSSRTQPPPKAAWPWNTVLMDESTLMSHRDLWVEEKDQHSSTELPLLSSTEQKLYQSIKQNACGQRVRLEQERIRWDVAWDAIQASIR